MLELLNMDCLEYMKGLPDKAFELAIVDPPYNVGASDGRFGGKSKNPARISGKINGKHYANHDKTPDEQFFNQLFRVSENQIIWGFNYYPQFLYHSGAIVWDKVKDGMPLSDCELAWHSLNKLVRVYRHQWVGALKGTENGKIVRIHPNQKPVALYRWLLTNYAKSGDRILDTHLGSGSSAIAAHQMGFDFVGCEIDKDYYDAACKRFKQQTMQQDLFKQDRA